jgi:L-alanine-DL-glutamate epimerase-like enolase superfamily enzyme
MIVDDGIGELKACAYKIPTDQPESDGTFEWNHTTLVLVEVCAMGKTGIGYTYASSSVAHFINSSLRDIVLGQSPFDTGEIFSNLSVAIRNEGHCGMAYMALSAIDVALWDLKARIVDMPLCRLIGAIRKKALVYGSGGFTSYGHDALEKQLGGWANDGFTAVKMKVGRQPESDSERVKTARRAIGADVHLFVDANGAYNVKQAISIADEFSRYNVNWFEEPVSSDDTDGLAVIRMRAPASIRIAAGEYGYAPGYFVNMIEDGAVDVLQADATRCGGITGFLKVGSISEGFGIPFSFHCAPYLHLHASLCVPNFCIGEYFHDHARIEHMLFDGAPQPVSGYIQPDLSQPGLGLTFKYQDAEKYKAS